MSVIALETKRVFNAWKTLSEKKEVLEFIENSEIFKTYNKPAYVNCDAKNFFGIASKYGLYANHFAYAVQYNEVVDIKQLDAEIEAYEPENVIEHEAAATYGSLMYNIHTNAGSAFLEERWLKTLSDIREFVCALYPEPEVECYGNWVD